LGEAINSILAVSNRAKIIDFLLRLGYFGSSMSSSDY